MVSLNTTRVDALTCENTNNRVNWNVTVNQGKLKATEKAVTG